jgi:hypothetical protein
MLITPDAEELTTTLPDIVAQSARAVASACELMVAVAWEQMADVWAGEVVSIFHVNCLLAICIHLLAIPRLQQPIDIFQPSESLQYSSFFDIGRRLFTYQQQHSGPRTREEEPSGRTWRLKLC